MKEGDLVVCIKDNWFGVEGTGENCDIIEPQKGQVYTTTELTTFQEELYLKLEGFRDEYIARNFAPLEYNQEEIEELMTQTVEA